MQSKEAGLTLIEVLVASIILFLAVAISSIAFKNGASNYQKVLKIDDMTSIEPLLLTQIKRKVEQAPELLSHNFDFYGIEVLVTVISSYAKDMSDSRSEYYPRYSNASPFIVELKTLQVSLTNGGKINKFDMHVMIGKRK